MFKACCLASDVAKNKFWNLGEKAIPKNSYLSPLLKTRTNTSFIPQALLSWQRAKGRHDNFCTHFLIFKCRPTREQNVTLHTISLDDTL